MKILLLQTAVFVAAFPFFSIAQTTSPAELSETIRQVSRHIGEMTVSLDAADVDMSERLLFEPYQQLEEMFLRDDVVYLMRHGPTDWTKLDDKNVAPTDCANQRVMSPEGAQNMRDFGSLLASNGILPSEIVVSEWCRNQQTVEHIFEGFDLIDPTIATEMPVETDAETNLLLSLQGARNVSGLRKRISEWDGNPDRKGPLLIVTHYTNIEELTQFRVFEGEMLVLDPKRDNLVLGYVRLGSSKPDIGHFSESLDSPLLEQSEALEMVERYYDALTTGNAEELSDILSERWIRDGTSIPGKQRVEELLTEVQSVTDGLTEPNFDIQEVYVTDEIVTVIGSVSGRHTGTIYGIEATDRDIVFDAIAVHRVKDGKITESWAMADRLGLVQQLAE